MPNHLMEGTSMQSANDYKEFAILYVDDEEKSLRFFRRAYQDKFRILIAANAKEGYRLLQENCDSIALLLADQWMPGEKGVQLLHRAALLRPQILRFLVTAYSDLDAAIDAVNQGAIFKYVSKPWDVNTLEMTLTRSFDYFFLRRERDQLLRKRMSGLHSLMVAERIGFLGMKAIESGKGLKHSLDALRSFFEMLPLKVEQWDEFELERVRAPEYWKEICGRLNEQVSLIRQIMDDLNGTAAASNPEWVSLTELLRKTASKMQQVIESKDVALLLEIPEDLPQIYGAAGPLRQLCQLLLAEGISAAPVGGKVRIHASLSGQSSRELQFVRVRLEADGLSIPDNPLRALFDPLYECDREMLEAGLRILSIFFLVHHHRGLVEVTEGVDRNSILLSLPTRDDFVEPIALRGKTDRTGLEQLLWKRLLSGS